MCPFLGWRCSGKYVTINLSCEGLERGGKMKRIVLICMSGLSTNLLVNKMKRTAKERGIEAEICAMSELAFTRYEKPTDVLLLGPQVSFRLEEMKQKLCPAGVRVALIEPEIFARMDAEAVLQQAMEA